MDFAKLSDRFHLSHTEYCRVPVASSYLHEGCTVLPTKSGRPLSVADKPRETVAPGEGAGAGGVLRHQDTGAHRLGGEVVVLARLTGVVGLQP